MATAQDILATVTNIEAIAAEILGAVETFAPKTVVPIEIAKALETLITKALSAYSAASETPITVEALQALLPNPEPLTPPTA